VWLSTEDETNFAAGVSCTSVDTAVDELKELTYLVKAATWLKSRIP